MVDISRQDVRREGAVVVADTGVGKFQVRAQSGSSTFLVDEPQSVGGLGSGPNPFDLLGAALGACSVMTMRLYADRKGFPLRRSLVEVRHFREPSGRDVFVREISLEGDMDPDQIQKIVNIAERCPVHLTLTRGAEVRTSLTSGLEPTARSTEECIHARVMEEACHD